MGKVFEVLRQNGSRQPSFEKVVVPSIPVEAPPDDPIEDVPFIEVGGRKAVLDASPGVLASMAVQPPHRPAPAGPVVVPSVRVIEPVKETALKVVYRPLSPEATLPPPHLRFGPGLVAFHQPDSTAGRQYQALAYTVGVPAAGVSRVLLFTAAAAQSGATTVVVNLAVALARQAQRRILVVDANFARPDVAAAFGLPDRPGLREVLFGTCLLEYALQESGIPNLSVLGVGGEGKVSRCTPEAVGSLVRELRKRFDVVLVDAPAAEDLTDTAAIATASDAVYAVVPQSAADVPATADFLRALAQRRCPVRGQILTER